MFCFFLCFRRRGNFKKDWKGYIEFSFKFFYFPFFFVKNEFSIWSIFPIYNYLNITFFLSFPYYLIGKIKFFWKEELSLRWIEPIIFIFLLSAKLHFSSFLLHFFRPKCTHISRADRICVRLPPNLWQTKTSRTDARCRW